MGDRRGRLAAQHQAGDVLLQSAVRNAIGKTDDDKVTVRLNERLG